MKSKLLKKTIVPSLFGILSIGISACASTNLPPPPCPQIKILGAASKLTRFKPGPGRDIIDQMHTETIVGFASGCEYNTDETGVGDVTILVVPEISSVRGPANEGDTANFEYFLIVTDSQKNVLEKDNFPVAIPYAQNLTQVNWRALKPNTIRIPLKAGQTGQDFQVVIGLQLNREELDYQQNQH
ncbi:MAG: hypothetical protein JKY17_02245 [Magnetovibrio sp.]|nr:hypothetical protein [Magnetovibrio sp.]